MNKKRSKPNLENKTKRNRKNISTKKLIFSEEIIEKPNFFYICDLVLPQEIFQSRKAKEEDREQDSQQFLSLWQHAAAVEPDLFFQIVKTITIYRGFNCTECRMIDLVISKFIVKNQVQGIELIKNIGKQMRNGKLEYSQRNAFFAQILSSISTLSNKTEKFLTDLILAISAETVEGDDPLADFLKDCLLQVQENYRCLIINNLLSNQMNSNINENNSNQEFHNEKQFKSMEIEKNSQNSQKNNGNSGKFSDPVLFLFQQIINSEYENNSSQKIMENALPAFLTKFSHLKFTKQQREYLSLGNFLSTQFSNLIHNNFIRFYAKLQIIRGLFTSKFQKETHINNEALVYNEYDCLGILESSFSENRGNLTEIIIPSIFFKVNEESKAFRTKLLSLILANGSNLATVFSTEGSCISFLNTISGRKKFQNHESDEIKSIRKFISKESIQSAWMQNTQPEYDPSRRPQAKNQHAIFVSWKQMRLLLNHLNNYQEIADIISDIYKVFIKNFDFEKETPVLRLIKLLMSEKSNSVDLLLLFVNEMESKISNANPKSSKIESNVASSFVLSFSSLLLLETSLLVENIEKIREFITSSLFIRNVIRKSENIMFTLLRTLKNTLKNELIIHLLKIIQSLFEDDPNIDFFRLHEERFFHSLCLDLMALVQENKQEAIQKQATQILRLIISHFAKQKNTQFLHSLVRILLRRENIDIEFMELIIHFFGLIQLNNFWKDFMLKNLQFLPRYSQNKMRLLSLIAKYKPEDLPNIHLLDQEFVSQIGINNDFVVSSFEFLDNCIDSRIDIVENNIDLLLLVSQSPKKVVISDVIRGFAETILNEFQKKKDINKK